MFLANSLSATTFLVLLPFRYEGGPDIVITKHELMETDDGFAQSDSFSNVQSTPAHCPECRDERYGFDDKWQLNLLALKSQLTFFFFGHVEYLIFL